MPPRKAARARPSAEEGRIVLGKDGPARGKGKGPSKGSHKRAKAKADDPGAAAAGDGTFRAASAPRKARARKLAREKSASGPGAPVALAPSPLVSAKAATEGTTKGTTKKAAKGVVAKGGQGKRAGGKAAGGKAAGGKAASGKAARVAADGGKVRRGPRQTFLVAATLAPDDGLRVYAAVKRSAAEALDAVRTVLGADAAVELTGSLSTRMAKALGLKPDEVRPI